MFKSYFDEQLDDWKQYEPNVPDEVVLRFAETISPYGTQKIFMEHGEMRTEVTVATIERKTLNTVQISSVANKFLAFSNMSLDDEDPFITNDMLDSEIVVTETIDVRANDNSVSYLDYAIFDDETINRIALRNPSAGTVSRIQELKHRKSVLEYVFVVTEAYTSTNYFKEVSDRIQDKSLIISPEDFPSSVKKHYTLYLGTVGNDIHKVSQSEKDSYKNVLGWAVNPFSPFNAMSVHALSRCKDGYEFQYDRRKVTRIETYKHEPGCYRYSAQASVAYIQRQTCRPYPYDKHQLVSHRYIPMPEGPESQGSRDLYLERIYIPIRSRLRKEVREVSPFGRIDVYFKGSVVYDLGLPFSYPDRYRYIEDYNKHINKDRGRIEVEDVPYAIAKRGDGYVLDGKLEATPFRYFVGMKYEIYDREGQAKEGEGEVLVVDGERYEFSQERDVYVVKIGLNYHIYVETEEDLGHPTLCLKTNIEMPMCPRRGKISLTSGYASVPSPPYLDEKSVPIHREISPLHYNDYVLDKIKVPMPNFEYEVWNI